MARRWQNLIHLKCPNCDSRLKRLSNVNAFACTGENPKCFYITMQKMTEIMTDPTHPGYKHMTEHEHEILNSGLRAVGLNV